MPNCFDERATASAEEKYVARKGITAKSLLYLQRQASHAAPHVGVARRKPDPHSRCNRDHRNARKIAVTKLADAVAPIPTRVPSGNVTLIDVLSSDPTLTDKRAGSSITTAGVNDDPQVLADCAC
jgi:hypothetical protein